MDLNEKMHSILLIEKTGRMVYTTCNKLKTHPLDVYWSLAGIGNFEQERIRYTMNLQDQQMTNSDFIYEDLCNKIENLEYMPGQRISENELCRAYSATRHMVRGALMKLKQRKLVEVYPQRGTFVSLIDMQYIADILFVREAMEQEAMKQIIESGEVDEVCRKMRACIELQKQCKHSEQYTQEFYQLDNAFHKCMYGAIGRGEIFQFISDPYIHFRRWRNFEILYSERVKRLIQEHEELVDAIEAEDAELARKCLHSHLDTVSRYSESMKDSEKKYLINL